MTNIHEPAVAGYFYPADAQALRQMIKASLDIAHTASEPVPKAIIAPHAGYIYSGAIAANAYACLAQARNKIHRVVLLGPAHRVAVNGLATLSNDYFATPLGQVKIDQAALAKVTLLPFVQVADIAHEQEHCLEVQLPFLQMLLEDFTLLPFVVGFAEAEQVQQVLAVFCDEPATLIVISSDLSHYHPYQQAQQIDAKTSQAIQQLQPQQIGHDNACGATAINGLLLLAQRQGLQVKQLDLRNSGDTAGDKSRVVGYGAYHFI